MEIQLSTHDKMLLELVRFALTHQPVSTALFDSADEVTWRKCYNLAKKQGVMAIAWDGVLSLSPNQLPPKKLKLNWAMHVEKYEKKYVRYVHTLIQLRDFYVEHGIGLILLKGVGLSSYYPVPEHREGGDLDIYTYSLDHTVMTDAEANHLANQLIIDMGIKVEMEDLKHCVFIYNGVMIENHAHFLNDYNLNYAKTLDLQLMEMCRPCEVSLLDGKAMIDVPSIEFNSLFVPFHAMQHWSDGLCLHHLCDWAVILQRYGLPEALKRMDPHFQQVLRAFTAFSNRYLGTDVPLDGYSDELFELLVDELFHPKYNKENVSKGKLDIFWFKVKSYLYRLKVRRKVLGQSVVCTLLNTVYIHIKYPNKIFKFH